MKKLLPILLHLPKRYNLFLLGLESLALSSFLLLITTIKKLGEEMGRFSGRFREYLPNFSGRLIRGLLQWLPQPYIEWTRKREGVRA
jgi:hypothetical protein